MNFLVHNMCRLPGSDGTWMIVEGRHGHRGREQFAEAAEAHGARIETGTPVAKILVVRGAVEACSRPR